MPKLEPFGYVVYVADTANLTSVSLTLLAPKAAALGKMTRNNGHYAVQGHSRSTFGTN